MTLFLVFLIGAMGGGAAGLLLGRSQAEERTALQIHDLKNQLYAAQIQLRKVPLS